MDHDPATVREVPAEETACTYRAMAALRQGRTQLSSVETYVAWVNERQRPEGYRLVACFDAGSEDAVSVAGFRSLHSLLWGQCLYIDDLVTLPDGRGRGHADALFSWLVAEAQRLGCEQIHLDSGMQRHAAHRFYLNHRLEITALHFHRVLEQTDER